jgi:hypothetical protein
MNDQPAGSDAPLSVLPQVVREIELHAASSGWDQQAQLFALVDTADLLRREPGLAQALGLDPAEAPPLTPVEQDPIAAGQSLDETLQQIVWPGEVAGCAAVVERLVLPPDAEDKIPDDPTDAAAYVAEHPERQEVRIVAAATRDGDTFCALRLRSHDEDASVVGAPDLVPSLLELIQATLEADPDE